MCPLLMSKSIQRSIENGHYSFLFSNIAHAQQLCAVRAARTSSVTKVAFLCMIALQESIADLQCVYLTFRMWMLIFIVTTYLKENITYVCCSSQGQTAEHKGKEEPMRLYWEHMWVEAKQVKRRRIHCWLGKVP